MRELSDPARKVLDAMIEFLEKNGYPPSHRDLSLLVKRAKRAIEMQLIALEARGFIRRGEGARSLVVLQNPDGSTYSPKRPSNKNVSPRSQNDVSNRQRPRAIVSTTDTGSVHIRIEGEIAAGPPVEPMDGPSLVELPGLAGTSPSHFWLRVTGSSMSRAGILPGSLVFCRRQASVDPGEIAVCLLEDSTVTLKCAVADRKNGGVRLVPQCDGLEPVSYRSVEIQARVLYVLRQV